MNAMGLTAQEDRHQKSRLRASDEILARFTTVYREVK
jgi:hypothetical protein